MENTRQNQGRSADTAEELLYASVFDNIPDAAVLCRAVINEITHEYSDFIIEKANRAFSDIFDLGKAPESLTSVSDHIPYFKTPEFYNTVRSAAFSGKCVRTDYVLESSGRNVRLKYFFPGSKNMCVVIEDVTVRKEKEKRLFVEEEITSVILGEIRGAVVLCGESGRVVAAKGLFFEDIGIDAAMLSKTRVENVLGEKHQNLMRGIFEMCLIHSENKHVVTEIAFKNKKSGMFEISAFKIQTGSVVLFIRGASKKAEDILPLLSDLELYRGIFENISNAVMVLGNDARIRLVNQASKKILGYDPEEMTGKLAYDFVADVEKDKAEKNFRDMMSGLMPRDNNFRLFSKKGSVVEVNINPFFVKNGNIPDRSMVVELRETGNIKRTQKLLEAVSARVRAMLDGSEAMIYAVTPEYKIEYINEKLAAITGGKEGDVCHSRIYGHQFPCDFCPMNNIEEGGHVAKEVKFEKENRRWHCVFCQIYYPDGQRSMQSFILDVTQERNAEEELKKSEDRYRSLIETANDIIWETDANMNYRYVSPTMESITGYKMQELIGKNFLDFVPVEEKRKEKIKITGILERRLPFERIESVFQAKTGEIMILERNGVPFYDSEGSFSGYRGISRDVSSRKEAERMVKKAMEIKSQFVSVVSHELRTPLTGIKEGIAIVLDGEAGEINDEQKNFLSLAKRNVDRLHRLINDVLDFQKLDEGRVSFRMEPNDINQVIRDVAGSNKPIAEENGLGIEVIMDDMVDEFVFDYDRITQVLANLVSNAIKATKTGKVTIKSELAKGGKAFRVSVKDSGCGIKDEEKSKVFGIFQQLNNEEYKKVGGTGLGLAICMEIILEHGGKLWFESEFGKGTEFIFEIPGRK